MAPDAAHANRCLLRLCIDRWVELDITDDGVGCEARSVDGLGLRSMADRVAELGGTFSVGTQEPVGTRVSVRLPVKP